MPAVNQAGRPVLHHTSWVISQISARCKNSVFNSFLFPEFV
jgi:hypothetical protein